MDGQYCSCKESPRGQRGGREECCAGTERAGGGAACGVRISNFSACDEPLSNCFELYHTIPHIHFIILVRNPDCAKNGCTRRYVLLAEPKLSNKWKGYPPTSPPTHFSLAPPLPREAIATLDHLNCSTNVGGLDLCETAALNCPGPAGRLERPKLLLHEHGRRGSNEHHFDHLLLERPSHGITSNRLRQVARLPTSHTVGPQGPALRCALSQKALKIELP